MKCTPKKKAEIIFKDHYFDQWCSDTANMTHNQRGIYSLLQRLYFKSAGEESDKGKITTDDWDLLCYRLDCHTQQDREDLALVLKDKFVIVNKYYRHRAWDKEIKNIRHKMSNDTSKSNGKDDDGNGVGNAHFDKSNADSNASVYTHDVGYAMTNAERQEKHRKLQRLINKGIQADKSMTLDEVRTLFDSHFGTSNGTDNTESNDNGNEHNDTSNAQNRANNYKLVVTNQELKNKESVVGVTTATDTHTQALNLSCDFVGITRPSAKATTTVNQVSIKNWEAPPLAFMQTHLTELGFTGELTNESYQALFAKFVNYYADKELDGKTLKSHAVRMDKWVNWIMSEKTIAPRKQEQSWPIVQDATPPSTKTHVRVGFEWKLPFDGMTPKQSHEFIIKHQKFQETYTEAYDRIINYGVERCEREYDFNNTRLGMEAIRKHNRQNYLKEQLPIL